MPKSGGKLDLNMYMKAVKVGVVKFFKEQAPYFFKNMKPILKKAPEWWKKQQKDEKIAYGVWVSGHFLGFIGIILMIVL